MAKKDVKETQKKKKTIDKPKEKTQTKKNTNKKQTTSKSKIQEDIKDKPKKETKKEETVEKEIKKEEKKEKTTEKKTSKLATTSMVLGIAGLLVPLLYYLYFLLVQLFASDSNIYFSVLPYCSAVTNFITALSPLAAIIIGVIAVVKIKRSLILKGKILAITGIICGSIDIGLWFFSGIIWVMSIIS